MINLNTRFSSLLAYCEVNTKSIWAFYFLIVGTQCILFERYLTLLDFLPPLIFLNNRLHLFRQNYINYFTSQITCAQVLYRNFHFFLCLKRKSLQKFLNKMGNKNKIILQSLKRKVFFKEKKISIIRIFENKIHDF